MSKVVQCLQNKNANFQMGIQSLLSKLPNSSFQHSSTPPHQHFIVWSGRSSNCTFGNPSVDGNVIETVSGTNGREGDAEHVSLCP